MNSFDEKTELVTDDIIYYFWQGEYLMWTNLRSILYEPVASTE